MISRIFQPLIKRFIVAKAWPSGAVQVPRFQAHRGCWGEGVFENTWQSLALAKCKGFQMAEIDVQLTRDQVPVLFHDEDLLRLQGNRVRVSDLSLSEFRSLFPVTTLAEALSRRDLTPFLNIELKTKIKFDEPLERKVSQVIHQQKAFSRVMFSSFNPFSLFRISKYLPQVPRALLVSGEPSRDNHRALREMWLAPFLELHALHFEKSLVNSEVIEEWRQRGMPLSVWTLQSQEEIQKFEAMKPLSLITDAAPSRGLL